MLRRNAPPRITLRVESAITHPKRTCLVEPMSSTLFLRAPTVNPPNANSAQGAVLDGDPVETFVQHPDVAELDLQVAAGGRRSVAVDPMAVQVQRDPGGTDHDAVVRAVLEVAVEGHIGGDRVAAVHMAREGPATADEQKGGRRECEHGRRHEQRHKSVRSLRSHALPPVG